MRITYITGAMKSGKTSLLIDKIEYSKLTGEGTIVMKPTKDTRTNGYIESRDGRRIEAFPLHDEKVTTIQDAVIKTVIDSFLTLGESVTVFVDEVHFLSNNNIKKIIEICKEYDVDVVFCGLTITYQFTDFESHELLSKTADKMIVVFGDCEICGKKSSSEFNLLFSNGRIVTRGELLIPGDTEYKAACFDCGAKY